MGKQFNDLKEAFKSASFGQAFETYDSMMKDIFINIKWVNYRDVTKKFICEMNEEEYEDYKALIQHLQITSFDYSRDYYCL